MDRLVGYIKEHKWVEPESLETISRLAMNILEIIGELCTIDSYFFKGWHYIFSSRYRQQVHQQWRIAGFLRAAPGVFYTLLLMVAEVLFLFYLVRAVVKHV